MSDAVDLRRLIALLRAWLPLMVLGTLLAGAAGLVVSSLQPRVYEARATMIVGQALSAANPDYSQLLVAQNLSATYAALAETRPILEALVSDLGLDVTPAVLASQVEVSAPRESTLLFITAQDSDPTRAAAIANALAAQLIAVSPTIQGREDAFRESIERDLAATQNLIERTQARADALIELEERTAQQESELQALEGRLANLRLTYTSLLSFSPGSATNLLTIVEPADPPASPVGPRMLLNTLLAAAFGLLVVVGLAFLAEQLDDRVRDPEAVMEATGLSTLGIIARMTRGRGREEMYQLAGLLFPRSPVAEAYRKVRTNIEFASVDAPLLTLLVTSSGPGEGKTVTAANLAIVFAQAGHSVLLVDADLRKPGLHAIFGLPNVRGLTTMLRDPSVGIDSVANTTEQPGLRVVTTGPLPPNPAELLGSQRMQALLQQMNQRAQLVIFDSPPLVVVTDAAVLSSFVDGTLLVIDADKGRRRVVRVGREALSRAGAHVLGAVLNRVPEPTQLGYGYYGTAKQADTSGALGPRLPDRPVERGSRPVDTSGQG